MVLREKLCMNINQDESKATISTNNADKSLLDDTQEEIKDDVNDINNDSENSNSADIIHNQIDNRIKLEVSSVNEYQSSDDESLQKRKDDLKKKLQALPNSIDTDELTEKALKSYFKEIKKNPKEKRNYTCEICDKILCSSTSLKTHMLNHTNETPFLCSICGKGFKTKLTYQEHLVTHDPNDPFKCNQCDKVYKNERKLKDHKLRAHGKVKPFLCGVCGKGLTQKDSLMKHMMIHTGEKPFECDLCGKHFRYMSVLKLHKRYHTGERPYPCTVS